MAPYTYSPLNVKASEIRLIILLPGTFEEPIQLIISHTSLSQEQRALRQATLITEEHQRGLSDEWEALESLEGRAIYSYSDPMQDEFSPGYSSWTNPSSPASSVFQLKDIFEPSEDHFDSKPRYEALSYTWDPLSINPDIAYIQSSTGTLPEPLDSDSTLELRPNLAYALRYLRLHDKPRTLWIDAISINQEDFEERESQVARMRSIFELAERVVVWLGPKDNNLAFSRLDYLGRQIEAARGHEFGPSPDCTEAMWFHPKVDLPFDEKQWKAIEDLLDCPWFDRVWIIQEIQLASSRTILVSGTDEILWYFFRRAIICLRYKTKISPKLLEKTSRICQYCWNKTSENLPYLLHMSGLFQCSVPSDKLYGVLGLAPYRTSQMIRPDYRVLTDEVYKDVFLKHTNLVRRLELLEACDIQLRSEKSPSWVPNWNRTPKAVPVWTTGVFASLFSASITRFVPPDVLEVTGVHALEVNSVGQTSLETEAEFHQLVQVLMRDLVPDELYVTGESLLDAYLWAISLGRLRTRDAYHPGPSLEELKEIILASVSNVKTTETHTTKIPASMIHNLQRCRFFRTKEGYVGIGPGAIQPDDIIAVILGCAVPMALRKSLHTTTFQVLGECFVHGIMDGEILCGPLPSPWIVRPVRDHYNRDELPTFYNSETKVTTQVDPRFGNLPEEWLQIDPQPEKTPDDPRLFKVHLNTRTGEVINSDPRLLPEMLEARGVKLEVFRLI